MEQVFRCQPTTPTHINEDAFDRLRALEREPPSGRLGRHRRWFWLVSSASAEEYDRLPPREAKAEAYNGTGSVPANAFAAGSMVLALGMKVLDSLAGSAYVHMCHHLLGCFP